MYKIFFAIYPLLSHHFHSILLVASAAFTWGQTSSGAVWRLTAHSSTVAYRIFTHKSLKILLEINSVWYKWFANSSFILHSLVGILLKIRASFPFSFSSPVLGTRRGYRGNWEVAIDTEGNRRSWYFGIRGSEYFVKDGQCSTVLDAYERSSNIRINVRCLGLLTWN